MIVREKVSSFLKIYQRVVVNLNEQSSQEPEPQPKYAKLEVKCANTWSIEYKTDQKNEKENAYATMAVGSPKI